MLRRLEARTFGDFHLQYLTLRATEAGVYCGECRREKNFSLPS